MPDRQDILATLHARFRDTDRLRHPGRRPPLGFGLAALDAVLPGGGLRRGGLHELMGETDDAARFGLMAALLGRLPHADGRILWCRTAAAAADAGWPAGAGLAAFGLAPARLIMIEARRADAALGLMEEGLRSRRLAAVVGEGTVPTMTGSRRLQLAAEAGDTPALLLLPAAASPPPSVALTRWRVAAIPGAIPSAVPGANLGKAGADGAGRTRWLLTLLRSRGGGHGQWEVEWDDEALCFGLAAPLGDGQMAAAE